MELVVSTVALERTDLADAVDDGTEFNDLFSLLEYTSLRAGGMTIESRLNCFLNGWLLVELEGFGNEVVDTFEEGKAVTVTLAEDALLIFTADTRGGFAV